MANALLSVADQGHRACGFTLRSLGRPPTRANIHRERVRISPFATTALEAVGRCCPSHRHSSGKQRQDCWKHHIQRAACWGSICPAIELALILADYSPLFRLKEKAASSCRQGMVFAATEAQKMERTKPEGKFY